MNMQTARDKDLQTAPRRAGASGWRGLRLWRSEAGSATLELTCVLTMILFPIFFGMVELGTLFHYKIELQNAAAAGAEYGARSSTNYTNITGMQNAASYEASDINMNSGYPLADYRACTDTNGVSAGCVTCTSSSCSWPTGPNSVFVEVTTKATVKELMTGIPITITGYATMRGQ
jgi:Flp pilus assembly protein TadG